MPKIVPYDLLRQSHLGLRLHKSELADLRSRAAAAGIPVGTYVRQAVFSRLAPAPPVRPQVPYTCIESMHRAFAKIEVVTNRLAAFTGNLIAEPRKRLPVWHMGEMVNTLIDDVAAAKADMQTALLEARANG